MSQWQHYYRYLYLPLVLPVQHYSSIVQNAAHAGWPIIILRVMEAVASFIPYGGVLMLIIVLSNTIGLSHLYHWMDGSLVDPKSEHFDVILYEKVNT